MTERTQGKADLAVCKESAALQYLQRDTLLNIDIIEPIRRGFAEILCAFDDSVLIREKRGGVYMLSADSPDAGARSLDEIKEAGLFVAHQDFMVEQIKGRFSLQNVNKCHNVVFEREEVAPPGGQFEIRPLDISHSDTVMSNYHMFSDPEYVKELIANGALFGAFRGGALCGFIGEHDEGSIGILVVLPEYRRQGAAEELARFMIGRSLARGERPFAQVIDGNEASMDLQRKLGMSINDELVYWIF